MFDVGDMPSGGEFWFALSRDWNGGGPPTMPPFWALPCSGSFPSPPRPKLLTWAFHVASVNPSLYAKSCMRLCIANRFASAASMSLRAADVNVLGSHPVVCHWFVQGYV